MTCFLKSIKKNFGGIVLILLSSVFVATGQLFWKLWSANTNYWLILGFILYIIGALTMTIAFRYGSFSVIHPMLSFSYILSLLLGYWVLDEVIGFEKIFGVIFIIGGVILIGGGDY